MLLARTMHGTRLVPLVVWSLALTSCDGKEAATVEPATKAEDDAHAKDSPKTEDEAKPTKARDDAHAKDSPRTEGEAKPPMVLSKGITTANLKKLLPAEIRGAKAKVMRANAYGGQAREGFAAAAYTIEDNQGRRFININAQGVKDLEFEKAQFLVTADNEQKEGNGRSLLGRMVDGRLVQRSFSHSMGSSEVIMLIDDSISLTVSVEKAKDPDEAFEILGLLDVDAIASIIP